MTRITGREINFNPKDSLDFVMSKRFINFVSENFNQIPNAMINKVILIGNVGADPEVRTFEGGKKMARIRLATTERIYNKQTQEAREHTEWHSVTLWSNLADVADRFVRKGSQVYVEGRIRSREWTDEAGNKRYATEIACDDLRLLGRKPEGASTAAESTAQPKPEAENIIPATPAIPGEDPDDLPF